MKTLNYLYTTSTTTKFTSPLHPFPSRYVISGIIYRYSNSMVRVFNNKPTPKGTRLFNMMKIETSVPTFIIIEHDGQKCLYDNNGNILYDLTGIDNSIIYQRCREQVYKRHEVVYTKHTRRLDSKPLTFDWGAECCDMFGGSLILYMKAHPKRSYTDCISMMTNEGYHIDDKGMVSKLIR